MKKILIALLLGCAITILPAQSFAFETAPQKSRSFYELRIYHLSSAAQLTELETYLGQSLVPALHRNGFKTVGVFKARNNDTAAVKKVYVLIPYKSLDQFTKLPQRLEKDKSYIESGKAYIDASFKQPAYARYETVLLQAFEMAPQVTVPKHTNPKNERVYELRSYEGHTEKIYRNKVQMFNQGGEVALFDRLGFNAVFYGEVLAGSRMPNLMYMTSFENMAARDAHWKAFGADAEWKKLAAMPQYQNNVSRNEIQFLVPAEYSDL